ncbi:MAG: histidine kinase dimerization/phospho-acceptor domain-containing protein [Myxococcales bacterium]
MDSPTAQPPFSAGDDGLYRRLVWTTLLRIALVSALLSVAAALLFGAEEKRLSSVEQALFAIVIGTYAASLVYLLVLRSAKAWRGRLAYAQVVGDVLIAACLVWLTGGTESILLFMFPLAVVTAAVLLYRRGAIFAAVLSSVALGVVVFGLRSGILPAPSASEGQPTLPLPRMAFFLFAHVSAVFLSAALASYLAEQLRSTRERLTVREHDYLALERLNESIVRSVSSGILTADRDGRVTYMNRAAEEICGFSLQQTQGEPVERRLPVLSPYLSQSGPGRFEAAHQTAAGEARRLGFAVAALYDRDGTSQGHVVAVEDLTSIRAMEEDLKRSEKLAAVGALAAGLAHELRNPLASMSGSIELLHGTASLGEEERKLMGIVLREADRLNSLVRDFLRFAKPTPSRARAGRSGRAGAPHGDAVRQRPLAQGGDRGRGAGRAAARAGRRGPAQPGALEPGRQRGGGHARRRPHPPDRPRRRLCGGARRPGRGPGHRRRGLAPRVRAVLHHQGRRHRAGSGHRPRNRREPPG